MKTIEFFKSARTLLISLFYFICAVLTVVINLLWLTDFESGINILIEIEKYINSFFLLFCSAIYFLMYVFSEKNGKDFEAALIILKVEASLEIAYSVYTAAVFILLLFAIDITLLLNTFVFLPAIIINAAAAVILTFVFVFICVILAVDITRNISKILLAGAVKKNIYEEKFRSKSLLFFSVMSFVCAGILLSVAAVVLFLSKNINTAMAAVFIFLLGLPKILSGIYFLKFNKLKKRSKEN